MWREHYQAGKFRDAEFVTTDSGFAGGRRLAKHEYPLRDIPYIEDLGRKARSFNLNLFVIGADYIAQRERLINALEAPGAGTLVHPYLGTMPASVESFRLNESTDRGGMARLEVTFIEAGENTFPTVAADTRANVNTQSEAAISTIKDVFNSNFSVVKQPQFVARPAAAILKNINNALLRNINRFPALPSTVSDFIADAGQLNANISTLLLKPLTLADSITGLFGDVRGLYSSPLSALSVYRRFLDYGDDLPSVPTTTFMRRREANNQSALTGLVRQTALIESARAASAVEFDSYNDAAAVRDELDEELDEQMLTADDATYRALNAVRVAMIKDITTRSADLARTVHYTPTTTLPALVVAHQLYGDAHKEADIIARNKLRHPGFVPGGKALEVLTHVA